MTQPWRDWIPGVLNKDQMRELAGEGLITVPDSASIEGLLDESSLDLTLSDQAFRMVHGSVKPNSHCPYGCFLNDKDLAENLAPVEDNTFLLKAKHTYIFKLRERLERKLGEIGFHGQATAKSSVGRVDVLARLIVDGMNTYEGFDPDSLLKQSGDMYLELTPITFAVKVRPETSLSQLRFFYGDPRHVEIESHELYRTIFHGEKEDDGSLTVSLDNTTVGGLDTAAFYAEAYDNNDPIALWETEQKPDPCKYWKLKEAKDNRLTIEAGKFYILRSKETLSLPPGIAIYCRASDETIGEMRIHYAGFVHPWFGGRRADGKTGTPLIFEVRGHQVDVSLAHGERMANLTFYRMSRDASNDGGSTEYEEQTLKLSKFFADWPERLERNADGRLQAA